jgi:hypothetical protein
MNPIPVDEALDEPGAALPMRWEPPEDNEGGTAYLPMIPGWIEQSRQALAVMEYVEDALDAEKRAAKLMSYAKLAEWPVPIVNGATLLRAEALEKIADLVDEGQARGEIALRGKPLETSEARTLKDVGVDRRRLAEGRQIRDLNVLDEARSRVEKNPETPVAFASLLRFKRDRQGRREHIEREQKARMSAGKKLPKYDIYTCSCAELTEHVKAASVDVILTDPPYEKASLPVWLELAEFAAHALKPGGLCVAYAGQTYLPEMMDMLREHLTYHWLGARRNSGPNPHVYARKANANFTPLLIYSNGKYSGGWFQDYFESPSSVTGALHKWGQNVEPLEILVQRFSQPKQLVCNPFLGSGTVGVAALKNGRRFVGCDIDPACVETARKRLAADV